MIDICTANVDDVANIHRVQIARVHDVIINHCLSVNLCDATTFRRTAVLQRINEISIENARLLLIVNILLALSKLGTAYSTKLYFFLSFIV